MGEDYEYLFKMVLLGDSGVGKTSFIVRYVDNDFNGNCQSTIGVDFKIKTVEIEGKRVKLQIWDTAGQERFNAIVKSYYRGADGIILLFDLTNRDTFTSIKEKWMKKIEENASDDVKLVLVGNKADRADEIVVTDQEVSELIKSCSSPSISFYLKGSAKNDDRVDDVFNGLAQMLFTKKKGESIVTSGSKKSLSKIIGRRGGRCC